MDGCWLNGQSESRWSRAGGEGGEGENSCLRFSSRPSRDPFQNGPATGAAGVGSIGEHARPGRCGSRPRGPQSCNADRPPEGFHASRFSARARKTAPGAGALPKPFRQKHAGTGNSCLNCWFYLGNGSFQKLKRGFRRSRIGSLILKRASGQAREWVFRIKEGCPTWRDGVFRIKEGTFSKPERVFNPKEGCPVWRDGVFNLKKVHPARRAEVFNSGESRPAKRVRVANFGDGPWAGPEAVVRIVSGIRAERYCRTLLPLCVRFRPASSATFTRARLTKAAAAFSPRLAKD